MKIITGILVVAIIALVAGCATSPEPNPSPQSPTPTSPESISATPSKSESNKTEPYEVSFHAYADTKLQGKMLTYDPTGLVMIKNTDNIQRTFKVEITHYYAGKGFTKEFTLQIEPGQIKSALATQRDMYKLYDIAPPGLTQEDSEIRRAIGEAGGLEMFKRGDWGIDYKVTPQ